MCNGIKVVGILLFILAGNCRNAFWDWLLRKASQLIFQPFQADLASREHLWCLTRLWNRSSIFLRSSQLSKRHLKDHVIGKMSPLCMCAHLQCRVLARVYPWSGFNVRVLHGKWRRWGLETALWESFAISNYSTHLETSVTGELSLASGNRPCRPTAYVFQMHVHRYTHTHKPHKYITASQSDINSYLNIFSKTCCRNSLRFF